LEPVPCVDDVDGEGPAGWDLQDSAAGVGDESRGGAQKPVAQRFRFGPGEVAVEGEMA